MKKVLKDLLAKFNLKIIDLRYFLKLSVEEKNVLFLNFDHVVSNYIMNNWCSRILSRGWRGGARVGWMQAQIGR